MHNIAALTRAAVARSSTGGAVALVEEARGGALTMTEAREILAAPQSVLLRACAASASGKLVKIVKPDPRSLTDPLWRNAPPLVYYDRQPMPASAPTVADELKRRVEALRRMLVPATEGLVRKWVTMMFETMDSRVTGDQAELRKDLLTRSLGLPAFCFRPETLEMVHIKQRRARPAGQSAVWAPSYARLMELLEPLTVPYREELTALEALERALQPAPALTDESKAPDQDELLLTDDGIATWLAAYEQIPPSAIRAIGVRSFLAELHKVNPAGHAHWREKIEQRLSSQPEAAAPERPRYKDVTLPSALLRQRDPEQAERDRRQIAAFLARAGRDPYADSGA